jgi:hypothetical protein
MKYSVWVKFMLSDLHSRELRNFDVRLFATVVRKFRAPLQPYSVCCLRPTEALRMGLSSEPAIGYVLSLQTLLLKSHFRRRLLSLNLGRKLDTSSVMDWDRNNAGLSEKDLENVFKYEKKSTTVVRMLVGEKVDARDSQGCVPILTNSQEPMIWSLDGSDEWDEWLQSVRKGNMGTRTLSLTRCCQERPRIDRGLSGLVLM